MESIYIYIYINISVYLYTYNIYIYIYIFGGSLKENTVCTVVHVCADGCIADGSAIYLKADPVVAHARATGFRNDGCSSGGAGSKKKGKAKEARKETGGRNLGDAEVASKTNASSSSSSNSNVQVHFARFNRFPQAANAAPNERERILEEEKRFGGLINESGLCIYKDDKGKHMLYFI